MSDRDPWLGDPWNPANNVKLLSHSLAYDHVLYCMDNETTANVIPGEAALVFFPHGGRTMLAPGVLCPRACVSWCDLSTGTWSVPVLEEAPFMLACPGEGQACLALLTDAG